MNRPELTVEEIGRPDELAACAEAWETLADRAGGDLFQTYEWVSTWLDVFWRDRPIRVLLVRDRGDLVGLAPFLNDKEGEALCGNSLALPIHPQIRRTDILAASDHDRIAEAILSFFHEHVGRVNLSMLVPRDSAMLSALSQVAERGGGGTVVRPETVSPLVRFDGDWDTYLQSRPRRVRKELKRKMRRAEKTGGVEWTVAKGPDEVDAAVAAVFQVEEHSWKESQGESISDNQDLREFFFRFARVAADRGWLRIHLLHLDGEPIAYIYGVVRGGHYYALKTSYDQKHRDLSPGIVLFGHALQDAASQGYGTFEFLGEDQRWKHELATESWPHAIACVVSRKNLRCSTCSVYQRRLKPELKRRLPAAVSWGKRVLGRN
ncbi:GNAT family N-acetyltransferase [Gemmatimonadota bacterium]